MDNIAKLKIDLRIRVWCWLSSSLAAKLFMKLDQPEADGQGRSPPPTAPRKSIDRRLTTRHLVCQRLLSEAGSEQFIGDFFGIHEQLLHMYFELPIPMYLKYLLQS